MEKEKIELIFVSRKEWEAEEPTSQTEFPYPPPEIQFTFTGGRACTNLETCIMRVKKLQIKHMKRGLPDIAYNFMIGGDNRVYEGRGWKTKPTNNEDYLDGGFPDERALLVAYIGSFDANKKNIDMTDVAHELVSYGYENKLMHGIITNTDPVASGYM